MNDIILFKLYSRNNYGFKYQYKTDFKGNNFIDLGNHYFNNFIPIKKTKNDTSIIIYFKNHLGLLFSILNLIPNYEVKQIKEEYNDILKGPKYIFIDYFEFNDMNSMGIGANETFLFYEEEKDYQTSISNKGFQNIYITKTDNYKPENFKSIIIYFNSNNNILFQIKKFNYSIFITYYGKFKPDDEFFSIMSREKYIK